MYRRNRKIVLVLFIILIASLAYNYYKDQPSSPATTTTNTPEQPLPNYTQVFQQAVDTSQISECAGLDASRRRNCETLLLSDKAIRDDNLAVCDEIAEVRDACIAKYNQQKAATTGDASVCDNSPEADQCYFRLAIATSDKTQCAKITSETLKSNCMTVVG